MIKTFRSEPTCGIFLFKISKVFLEVVLKLYSGQVLEHDSAVRKIGVSPLWTINTSAVPLLLSQSYKQTSIHNPTLLFVLTRWPKAFLPVRTQTFDWSSQQTAYLMTPRSVCINSKCHCKILNDAAFLDFTVLNSVTS